MKLDLDPITTAAAAAAVGYGVENVVDLLVSYPSEKINAQNLAKILNKSIRKDELKNLSKGISN
jgi:hypothetical protein